MFRSLVCSLFSAALAWGGMGCTSERVVKRPQPGTVVEKVRVGDEVRITASNGREYFLEVIEVGPDYLRGDDPDTDKRYRIPFDKIKVMRYEALSAEETAAAVGVGTVALYALAIAALGAALSGFGEGWGDAMQCLFSFGFDCGEEEC